MSSPLPIAAAAARFAVGVGFLDTASVGAPPDEAWDAMRDGLDAWRTGVARPQDYDAKPLPKAREDFCASPWSIRRCAGPQRATG